MKNQSREYLAMFNLEEDIEKQYKEERRWLLQQTGFNVHFIKSLKEILKEEKKKDLCKYILIEKVENIDTGKFAIILSKEKK